MKRTPPWIVLWFGGWCLLAQPAVAQSERYELGKRLQRFEQAWEAADPEGRAGCVTLIDSAVRRFFAFNFRGAAQQLDEASLSLALRAGETPEELLRFALAQRLTVSPRLADRETRDLRVELQSFYNPGVDPPENATLVLRCYSEVDAHLGDIALPLQDLMQGSLTATLPEINGDVTIAPVLALLSHDVALPPLVISRIENLEQRLSALEFSMSQPAGPLDNTAQATLRELRELLRSMQAGQAQETDYPAERLLRFCEAMGRGEQAPEQVILEHACKADCWLRLAHEQGEAVVRLRAPTRSSGPLPVLFVFHGAGGSENMFFETYGAGQVVQQALARGWLVVAPRQGIFGLGLDCGEMLEVLAHCFEIDRTRIMLLGHSMGAAQVLRQVGLDPSLPRAAVALGGGSSLRNTDRYQSLPWFVAAGAQDFGRLGARALRQSLQSSGVPVIYREYADVEHMVIVQAATPDVFRFFDEMLSAGEEAD